MVFAAGGTTGLLDIEVYLYTRDIEWYWPAWVEAIQAGAGPGPAAVTDSSGSYTLPQLKPTRGAAGPDDYWVYFYDPSKHHAPQWRDMQPPRLPRHNLQLGIGGGQQAARQVAATDSETRAACPGRPVSDGGGAGSQPAPPLFARGRRLGRRRRDAAAPHRTAARGPDRRVAGGRAERGALPGRDASGASRTRRRTAHGAAGAGARVPGDESVCGASASQRLPGCVDYFARCG